MGASDSVPSLSVYTHESVYSHPTSQQTRQLMNDILQYMLNRLTIHDLTAMSDPTHCRNYVAFKADHLYRFFHHLQITPVRDERDRIFFQSVRTLSEPPIREEQNQLCFTIAYFYTRIFQIYGALALTLHDDINYMRDSGILPNTMAPLGQFYSSGGAITEDIGNFNFLRSFLSERTEKGYISSYQTRGLIYFNRAANQIENMLQNGHFLIEIRDYTRASRIKFNIRVEKPPGILNEITMYYINVTYKLRGEETEKQFTIGDGILQTNRQIKFVKDSTNLWRSGDRGEMRGVPALEYLTEVFNRLIPYIERKINEERDARTRSTHVEQEVRSRTATTAPAGRGSEAALRLLSQVRINDKLQIRNIISNLVEQRPLAHCVARAMQLLRMLPSGNVSHICKASFRSAPGDRTKMGTPEPRSTLNTNIGIASLSQLFYDTITGATPSLEIGTRTVGTNGSSRDQYIALMRRLSTLFEGNTATTAKTDDAIVTGGPAGITNRRDVELCRGIDENLALSSQTNIVAIVNRYVTTLYQFQYDHSVECGRIINELFEIRRDSVSGQNNVRIHPRLFDVGMSELERINGRARTVLTRYYSFCEFIYTFTMQLILRLRTGSTAPLSRAPAAPLSTAAPIRPPPNPAHPIPPPGGFPPRPPGPPPGNPPGGPPGGLGGPSGGPIEYGEGPPGAFAAQVHAQRTRALGPLASPLHQRAMARVESTMPSSRVSQVTPGISSASSSTGFMGGPGVTYSAAPKPVAALKATTATGTKIPVSKDTPVLGFTPASSQTTAASKAASTAAATILNKPVTGTPLFVPSNLSKKPSKSALRQSTIKGMHSKGYGLGNLGFDD